MISVRVTGPAFCIPGLNEAMVTFARWKIFVLIPVNALHDREGYITGEGRFGKIY